MGWSWLRSSSPTKNSSTVTYAGSAAFAMSMLGEIAAMKYPMAAQRKQTLIASLMQVKPEPSQHGAITCSG